MGFLRKLFSPAKKPIAGIARCSNTHPEKINCACETAPIIRQNYTSTSIGVDYRNGRFADVALDTCIHCQRIWLHYSVEYETFSYSGRWYRGLVDKRDIPGLIPENAIEYIEGLSWYLYGGSYFSNSGRIGSGKARVDL